MAKKSMKVPVIPAPDEGSSHQISLAGTIAATGSGETGSHHDLAAPDLSFLLPSKSPAPRFPLDTLPEQTRSLVLGFANTRLLSVDYCAASILTACSGAIGNRARLLTFEGDHEPLSVFCALVGPPSTGKSLAINIVEKPLISLDQALQQTHKLILRGVDQKLLEKFDQKLRETVARRLLLEDLPFENDDEDCEMAAPGIVLSEFTGAGLLEELRTGIDGRMLVSHELTGALAFGAAYQGLRSRGLLLEGFDGKPRIVRTKTEGKVVIPALLISVLGATQPDRLPDLLGDAHDGLAARMWWIYPDVEPRTCLPAAPGPVDQLTAILTRLIAIPPANASSGYSTLVPLGSDARAPLEAAATIWARMQPLTDGLYRDLVGRALQQTMRLSALLSIVEHAATDQDGLPRSVGAANVEAAVHIVHHYLLPMGERALGTAQGPRESDASRLARFIARIGKSTINVRDDVLRASGSPIHDREIAAEAFEELRRRKVVWPADRDPAQKGRPPTIFKVHASLLALSSPVP